MEGRVKELLVDGKYHVLVSDLGHIYNMHGREYHIDANSKGYARVGLSTIIDGKKERHRYTVHRLVATAFIPNPHNLPQINHKDLCKTNNFVGNLEWCDQSHNMLHSHRLRKAGIKPKEVVYKQAKSAAEYLQNKEWTNFLKSVPLGKTEWSLMDDKDLGLLRTTASYITRELGSARFSIRRNAHRSCDFAIIKYAIQNGN